MFSQRTYGENIWLKDVCYSPPFQRKWRTKRQIKHAGVLRGLKLSLRGLKLCFKGAFNGPQALF
jgi:hypothetical protein